MHFKKDLIVKEYCNNKNPELKEKIMLTYTPLVKYIARKLSFDRNDLEDITQIGFIGLLRSIDKFEPAKKVDFATFATPNIIGEIRHYFRDKKNIVKIPRKLQEIFSKVQNYIKVKQVQGFSPTIAEIANALTIDEDRVIEAIEAKYTASVISLDMPISKSRTKTPGSRGEVTLIDSLSTNNKENDPLNELLLKDALSKLDEREQKIISLKFYQGFSQSEIAEKIGLSQMHISRLLQSSIKKLRNIIHK